MLTQLSKLILTNKLSKSWFNLVIHIVTLPLYVAGYLIPKSKNNWVLCNRYGYKDNCKYLYEYLKNNQPSIKLIWITKDLNEYHKLKNSIHIYYYLSPPGLIQQYRSGVMIFSTGLGDLARFTTANTTLIQLWHGSPLKHILLDSKQENKLCSIDIVNSMYEKLLASILTRYAFIIAPSQLIKKRFRSAFALPDNQIKLTGYPRVDFILENTVKYYHNKQTFILYAPTWREHTANLNKAIDQLNSVEFNTFLASKDFKLIIKIHPLSIYTSNHIPYSNIEIDHNSDTNELLAKTDILITDYSSLFYDFSILKRPIIFYSFDIDEYTSNRGLYEDYYALTSGLLAKSINELKMMLENTSELRLIDSKLYNEYTDGNSNLRIYNEINKVLA